MNTSTNTLNMHATADNNKAIITTVISNAQPINAVIKDSHAIGAALNIPEIITEEHDVYDGATVVTPSAHTDQILLTANKIVEENITVEIIPTFETSNEYGISFIIGD